MHLITGVRVVLVCLQNQLIDKHIKRGQYGFNPVFRAALFCFTVDTYLLLAKKHCVLMTGNSGKWFCESLLIDWFNSG